MASFCDEEQEELEALSLRDLPDSPTKEVKTTQFFVGNSTPEEFDFRRSGSGSVSIHPEMCAAEDVFFRGQILPLRCSVEFPKHVTSSKTRSLTRSQSMNNSFPRRQSVNDVVSKPRVSSREGFQTGNRHLNYVSMHEGKIWRKEKSGVWGFFRFGLMRNPGFRDLRVGTSDSSVHVGGIRKVHNDEDCGNPTFKELGKPSEQSKQGFAPWRRKPIASSCYCSVGAVKPSVQKQSTSRPMNGGKKEKFSESKRELSRRRADEWIKQLPRASCVEQEPLL